MPQQMQQRPPMQNGMDTRRAFRRATVKREAQAEPAKAWVTGGNVNFILPQVGFLMDMWLRASLTVTFSALGTANVFYPWNIFTLLNGKFNIGLSSFIDNVRGYDMYLINRYMRRGFAPDKAGCGDTTPSTEIYSAPLSAGAQTWNIQLCLPISANSGDNKEMGLVNLSAPQLFFTQAIQCSSLATPATNITAITGNLDLYYRFYDPVNPRLAVLPPRLAVRTLSDQKSVTATNTDLIYQFPNGGHLLYWYHVLQLNNALSNAFTNFKLRLNRSEERFNVDRQMQRFFEQLGTGLTPLTGVVLKSLWEASGEPARGAWDDVINTQRITTLESILSVNGALGGAGTDNLYTTRRIVQEIGVGSPMVG